MPKGDSFSGTVGSVRYSQLLNVSYTVIITIYAINDDISFDVCVCVYCSFYLDRNSIGQVRTHVD